MGLLSALHQNLERVVDHLFPPPPRWSNLRKIEGNLCQRCGYPFQAPLFVPVDRCSNCSGMEWMLDRAYSCFAMEGELRKSILEFKYHQKFYWRRPLGNLLVEAFEREFRSMELELKWDALVPVPLHRSKLRKRGFNQAEELARVLSEKAGIPIWNCLGRPRETLAQASQDRSKRLTNPEGSFEMRTKFDVGGRALLIVDDVLTTGTTANTCAQVLREAGARRVAVITVARGVGS